MFKIVQMISQETIKTITNHLDEVIEPTLTPDVSRYAVGRMRSWLQYAAPLGSYAWQPGVRDPRLWSYLTRVSARHGFTPDLGLVSKGGHILPHRDAGYSNAMAMGINLGECTWEYQRCHPGFRWIRNQDESAPTETYHLTGGEVFFFNCKNPHSVKHASADRWAINLWTVSKKGMSGFTAVKEANP